MVGLVEALAGEHGFDAATSFVLHPAKERFSVATEGYVGSPIHTHRCRFSLARAVASRSVIEAAIV